MLKTLINFTNIIGRLGNFPPKLLSNMASISPSKIVWMDMEMTGLDVDKDYIMEIACLITDSNLNIIAEGPELILHQPDIILDNMNEWCTKQHGQTGLTTACRQSTVSVQEAEETLFNFVSRQVLANCSPLAGNSVYMDRLFLKKFMPRVNNYLHYRIIDVSTIKELCRMWNPNLYKSVPSKDFQHRALSDIKESLEELKFYRNNFFHFMS